MPDKTTTLRLTREEVSLLLASLDLLRRQQATFAPIDPSYHRALQAATTLTARLRAAYARVSLNRQ